MEELISKFLFLIIVIVVVIVAAYWRVFQKAGRPGWAAIIPIYNYIVLLQVAGLSPWLILVFLASIIPILGPLVVCVFAIYVAIKVAAAFGKGILFGLGLAFLGVIFYPILGFGSAQYQLNKEAENA